VPLNGLPADKAVALAQFIRFALGPTGQGDIANAGAAPATQAMVSAGLAVAQEVDAESASSTAATTGTTTTTTTTTPVVAGSGTSTTTTTSVLPAASSSSGSSSSGSTGGGGSSSSSGLAFTGSNPIPLVVVGVTLILVGEVARRRFKRRIRRP